MWSAITSAISVVKALIELLAWYRSLQKTREAEAIAARASARQKAEDDLKAAKTDAEAYDAQTRIVNNKP